jgi:hypothetical protein
LRPLLVFLHGTALMHAGAAGVSRARRVQQVREGDPSVRDFAAYVPAEAVVQKLRRWQEQGAEILYLSSRRTAEDVVVLERHGFPPGRLLFRRAGESYAAVVERNLPDVLIEDDCESIGAAEMTYPRLSAEARSRIAWVVVPEFGGFGDLPDSVHDLEGVARRLDDVVDLRLGVGGGEDGVEGG